jgi:hypothetical protein
VIAKRTQPTKKTRRAPTVIERIRTTLATADPEVRRRVIELLDINVTLAGWDQCTTCAGNGSILGEGQRPGWRGTGTVTACPTCRRFRLSPAPVDHRGDAVCTGCAGGACEAGWRG